MQRLSSYNQCKIFYHLLIDDIYDDGSGGSRIIFFSSTLADDALLKSLLCLVFSLLPV